MTTAVVDTACPWCILNREQATALDPNYRDNTILFEKLEIRGYRVPGVLVRWPITLLACEGHDVIVDGAAFVPDEDLNIPNFIGLDGLLSRIKFAVDPNSNSFYFGTL